MATNFLWYSGATPYNGLVVTALTVLSTELVSLGSSSTVVGSSTTSGTASGVYTSSMTGQAVWADLFLTCGTSLATGPSLGGNISGWFLTSPDGGTTFERTVSGSPLPRAPDFVVPTSTQAVTAADTFRTTNMVRLPALPFKVFIQNNLGVTLPSSATAYSTLKIAAYALQY